MYLLVQEVYYLQPESKEFVRTDDGACLGTIATLEYGLAPDFIAWLTMRFALTVATLAARRLLNADNASKGFTLCPATPGMPLVIPLTELFVEAPANRLFCATILKPVDLSAGVTTVPVYLQVHRFSQYQLRI